MWHKVEVDMSAWYGEKSDFLEKQNKIKTGKASCRQIIMQTYIFFIIMFKEVHYTNQ